MDGKREDIVLMRKLGIYVDVLELSELEWLVTGYLGHTRGSI